MCQQEIKEKIKDNRNNEMVEFRLNGCSYGIRASFVNEIMTYTDVTPIPNVHPSIEGIFMPRDKMICVVDLKHCLNMGKSSLDGQFIVTTIGNMEVAFHIDNVTGIHNIAEGEIMKENLTEGNSSYTEGVLRRDGRLIMVLNVEKIVQDVK